MPVRARAPEDAFHFPTLSEGRRFARRGGEPWIRADAPILRPNAPRSDFRKGLRRASHVRRIGPIKKKYLFKTANAMPGGRSREFLSGGPQFSSPDLRRDPPFFSLPDPL